MELDYLGIKELSNQSYTPSHAHPAYVMQVANKHDDLFTYYAKNMLTNGSLT